MGLKTVCITLFIVFFLFNPAQSVNPFFCSINCLPTSCASILPTGCNACAQYYVLSGTAPNTCVFNTALTTVKQSKIKADFTLSPNPTSNCSAYFYWGEYLNNSQITLTTTSVPEPHYQIQLISWLLLVDQWPGGSFVNFKLISTGQTFQASQASTNVNTAECYSGANDGFARFSSIFTHTDTTNPIVWNVTTVYTHSSAKLGIKDFVLITYLCHPFCLTCTGPASNVCSSCISTHFLSGTTCDTACLPGYGTNLPSNVCVACHAYCLTCVSVATNCTVCRDTVIIGTNVTASQIYKVQNFNQCEAICPNGYYSHLASKMCLSCVLHCPTLTITSQLLNAGESLQFTYTFSEAMNFVGFNYANFLNFNCTNSSINTATDFNIVYAGLNSTSFKMTLTPNQGKYLVSSTLCTVIKAQAVNAYQYSTALNKLAPSVYTSYNCLVWSTPQVTMTISNVVTQPSKSIEWTFTFSAPMTFTGFIYTDFVYFNSTDATNSLSGNFTYLYTMVDNLNFKLKMTANPNVFFGNNTICAISKAQVSTTLQFSTSWYKLAPSVYGQFSCGILYVCHPYCLTCDLTPTNCFTCDNTIIVGTNTTASQIYKVEDQNKCQVICPAGYYSFLATKQCLSCAIHCVTLTITSQLLNSGESLEFTYTFSEAMNFVGFNYANFLSFNCTNSSINTVTDFNIVFTTVGTTTFKLTLTPIPTKYLVNSNLCTVITSEGTNPYQYSSALNKLAPSVYTSYNCLLWSTPQVTMSIGNIVSQATKSIEWTFTFSSPMTFTGFVYTDYIFFNSTDPTNNLAGNFTYLYTMIDNMNFKVKMTANPMVFFGNSTFCAISKSQGSTSLQFSASWFKLAPSVYDKYSCGVLYVCHPYCLACDGNPTNCSTCGDTILIGTNTTASQIYKVENVNSCQVICPAGFYSHLPSKTCLSCALHCVNMTISSQLISNGASLQFVYTFSDDITFSAFNYGDFLSFNCTNSSINTLTEFNIVQTILNTTSFKLTLTPIPTKYLVNENFCTVIKPEATNPYQFSSNLKRFDSTIYTMFKCLIWSNPQVNLLISNFIDPIAKYLEYTFTFNSSMNFTGFSYTDFVDLNQTDTTLTLSGDFVITYTMVDDKKFKLRITPNLPTYFTNQIFCAVTKLETLTTLQFSKDWFKLNPSVYGQENCITWTIPSVFLNINGNVLYDLMVEFNFIFTYPMDFNSFNYTDFLSFSLNITSLNFSTDFTITYTKMDSFSFKLTFLPTQNTYFKYLQICSITKQKLSTSLHFSQDNTPLNTAVYGQNSCLVWSTPAPPAPFEYLKNLEELNNHMEDITTQKGTQQIIKSGVFAFFFPGAQLSSTVLLHSPKINQNLYEGARFWGTFVFFDVPPYEQNSNKTKYTFESTDQEILQSYRQRRLQQQNSTKIGNFVNQWKFDRTGHTGFFIFDAYIQLFLLGSAWIVFLAGWMYEKKYNPGKMMRKINTRIIAIFHKIHEISLFYLVLASLIEFKNFDINHYLHRVSMIISAIVLTYYMVYELKIFYDMIDYPKVKIDTVEYKEFVKKYSIFIAYYRFEEYNDKNGWTWRHFLRPYNYHILTFIKKALILTAIPIFYEHGLGPIVILTLIQLGDVIRFVLTIPYHRLWRNVLYFGIQLLLLLFFIASFVNQIAALNIFDKDGFIVDTSSSSSYKVSGSLGIILIFTYNVLYSLSSFAEIIIILVTKDSLQNMVWSNRNSYYKDLYDHFEQYGSYYRLVKHYTDELAYNRQRKVESSFKAWVNKLHDAEPIVDLSDERINIFKEISQRGNLLASEFQEEDKSNVIEVRIQSFKVNDFQRFVRLYELQKSLFAPKNQDSMLKQETRSSSNDKGRIKNQFDTKSMKNLKTVNIDEKILFSFDIEYEIIPEIYKVDDKENKRSRKKIKILKKIKNKIQSDLLNPHFQKNLARTLISYQIPGTQDIKLSTFLKIDLAFYMSGQKISYRKEDMRQQIEIIRGRYRNKIDLKEVMTGFPVDWESLQKTKSSSISSYSENTGTALKRSRYGKDLNSMKIQI